MDNNVCGVCVIILLISILLKCDKLKKVSIVIGLIYLVTSIICTCLFSNYSSTEVLLLRENLRTVQDNTEDVFYISLYEKDYDFYYTLGIEGSDSTKEIKAFDTYKYTVSSSEVPYIETYVYPKDSKSNDLVYWLTYRSLFENITGSREYKLAYYNLYIPDDSKVLDYI